MEDYTISSKAMDELHRIGRHFSDRTMQAALEIAAIGKHGVKHIGCESVSKAFDKLFPEQPTPPPSTVEAAIEEYEDGVHVYKGKGGKVILKTNSSSGWYEDEFIADTLLAALQAAKEANRA